MVDIASFIFFAGILIFAAHFFEWLFNFSRIPNVLLLMVVGIILGPLFGAITPEFFGQAGVVFAVVVLAIILFDAGCALRLDVMRKSLRGTILLALVGFSIEAFVVGTIIYIATGIDIMVAYMIGVIVGGASSVVVIPLADQLRIGGQARAMLTLESALTDVLSVSITIALLAAYKLGHFNAFGVLANIIVSFAGSAGIGVVGGLVWSLLLVRVRHVRNSLFMTPAAMFILFGIAENFGVSGPIAALAFGITMGNISTLSAYMQKKHSLLHILVRPVPLSKREKAFFAETVFLLQTFFFIYVGMSITASDGWLLFFAAVIVVVLIVLRIPVVNIAAPTYLPVADRSVMAVMVPKGIASAVLAMLVVQEGALQRIFVQNVVYAMILWSIVGTSGMTFLLYKTGIRKIYERILGTASNTTSRNTQYPIINSHS